MPAGANGRQTYFFLHVMKTAGMTLNEHLDRNFPPEERFPTPGDPPTDYMVVSVLRDGIDQRRDRVRLWRGHYPAYVTEWVPEATTLTLLREPVARTISQLVQYREHNRPGAPLEEIYADPKVHRQLFHNLQTKVFSLVPEDDPAIFFKPIDLDHRRLAAAKARLARFDLVGIRERFDPFLAELHARFGWRIDALESVNIGERAEIPAELRDRIEADNELDAELYAYARTIAV